MTIAFMCIKVISLFTCNISSVADYVFQTMIDDISLIGTTAKQHHVHVHIEGHNV